jgi:hypothetical protein
MKLNCVILSVRNIYLKNMTQAIRFCLIGREISREGIECVEVWVELCLIF